MTLGYTVETNIPDNKFVKYLAIFNYKELNTYVQYCLTDKLYILKYKFDPEFIGVWKKKI